MRPDDNHQSPARRGLTSQRSEGTKRSFGDSFGGSLRDRMNHYVDHAARLTIASNNILNPIHNTKASPWQREKEKHRFKRKMIIKTLV
jgi:hypothetical protein